MSAAPSLPPPFKIHSHSLLPPPNSLRQVQGTDLEPPTPPPPSAGLDASIVKLGSFSAIARVTTLQHLTIGGWGPNVYRSDPDAAKTLASLTAVKQLTALRLSSMPGKAATSLPPLPALVVRELH